MASPAALDRKPLSILVIDLAICAAVGAVLGVLGPFGSYLNGGVFVRLAYWMTTLALTGAILSALMRALAPAARRRRIPIWVWLPLLVLAANGPFSVASRAAAVALWPGLAKHVGQGEWFAQSLMIGLLATSAFAFFRLRSPADRNPAAQAGSDQLFPKRLPAGVERDLVCLQMEDHYVRVHTAEGSRLVLIPLRQAISELAGVEGLQVHRSWWVARSAVVGVVSDSRSVRLKLTNGVQAPVSRAQVARLRAAGWID